MSKIEELEQKLVMWRRVAVGFSGGVDSTLLLYLALRVLDRESVLAVTVDTPLMPRSELESARGLAVAMGARVVELAPALLSESCVIENQPERCYYCKRLIFGALKIRALEDGFEVVLDGSNLDDASDFRPGARALAELGIRSPLQEVGLTKQEIRQLSQYYGLPTAEKPAMACLASRIPYGTPLTHKVLGMIEQAEKVVREAGFNEYRVRHHDDTARVELPEGEMARMGDRVVRQQVVAGIKAAGYRYVVVDLEGYRMGSLNELLTAEQLRAGRGGKQGA